MIKCEKCGKVMSSNFEEFTAAKYYCKDCRKNDSSQPSHADGLEYFLENLESGNKLPKCFKGNSDKTNRVDFNYRAQEHREDY